MQSYWCRRHSQGRVGRRSRRSGSSGRIRSHRCVYGRAARACSGAGVLAQSCRCRRNVACSRSGAGDTSKVVTCGASRTPLDVEWSNCESSLCPCPPVRVRMQSYWCSRTGAVVLVQTRAEKLLCRFLRVAVGTAQRTRARSGVVETTDVFAKARAMHGRPRQSGSRRRARSAPYCAKACQVFHVRFSKAGNK